MKYVQLLMVLMLLPVAFAGTMDFTDMSDFSYTEDLLVSESIVNATTSESAPTWDVVSITDDLVSSTLVASNFTFDSDGILSLSWVPENNDVGTHNVSLNITDNAGVDTALYNITLTVANVNDAPTAVSLNTTLVTSNEDENILVNVTGVTDVDVDDVFTLSYEFDVEPTTTPTFTDNGDGTGQFDWTPVNADVGSYEVNVTASDAAGASVSEVLTIEVVNVNDTPVIDTVADQAVSVNIEAGDYQTLEVVFSASDEDVDIGLDSLTYTVSHAFAGASSVVGDTWTFTPVDADIGTQTVNVTVTDSAGLTDSTTFDVTVSQNYMPVFDSDVDTVSTTVEQDDSVTISYAVSDADGDSLTYSVSESFVADYTVGESTLADATFTDSGMTWTPGALDVGVHTFTIIVSDGSYEAESSEVVITVTDVDDAPVAEDVDDVNAEVGDDLIVNITVYDPEDSEITVTTWDVDCDDSGCDSTLDVDVDDALDDFLYSDSPSGFTLEWEPESDDVGTHEIRIVFEDENENAVTVRFEIEVDEVSTEYDDEIEDLLESFDDYQDDFRALDDDYCNAEEDDDVDELDDIIDDLDDLDDDLVDLDEELDDLQEEIDDDSSLDNDIQDDLLDDLEDLEDDITDLRSDIADVIDDGAYCVSTYSTYTTSSDSTSATTYTSTTTTSSSSDEEEDRTVTVTTIPASTTTVASTSTEQNFGDLRVIMYMAAALVIIFAMLLFMIALLFSGKKRK